jgi:hypothetical protein
MVAFQGDTVGRVKERMQERLGVNDKVLFEAQKVFLAFQMSSRYTIGSPHFL